MQSIIELKQLEFFAYHGVLEHEKQEGNTFIVDVTMHVDISQAMQTDALEDTVNYAEVYASIKKEMEKPSELLEHAVGRILQSLRKDFPQVKTFQIRLAKLNPPIGGTAACARITVIDSQD